MTAAATTQSGGLVAWIMQYGQIVAFFAQLAYWLVLVVLLAYAVAIYKKYTNYIMGVGRSGQIRLEQDAADAEDSAAPAKPEEKKKPSVDEFVE